MSAVQDAWHRFLEKKSCKLPPNCLLPLLFTALFALVFELCVVEVTKCLSSLNDVILSVNVTARIMYAEMKRLKRVVTQADVLFCRKPYWKQKGTGKKQQQ